MYRIRIPIGLLLLATIGGIVYLDYRLNTALFCKGIVAVLSVAALWEFYRLLVKRGDAPYLYYGTIAVALGFGSLMGVAQYGKNVQEFHNVWIAAMTLGLLLRMLLASHDEKVIEKISLTALGIAYLYILPAYLLFILDLGKSHAVFAQEPLATQNLAGLIFLLFTILVAKGTDIGGYLVGSLIGKHKLCPHISPKKSWEGFGGGILVSLGMAFGVRYFSPIVAQHLSVVAIVVFALWVSVLSLLGDLTKSIVKRRCQVKNSSNLIPEFGGILDLIDSLLLVAPVAYYFLAFSLTGK